MCWYIQTTWIWCYLCYNSIAGDIFECQEDIQDESIWKANSNNVETQKNSRKCLVEIADYIIPGHGPMFKVPER